MTEKDLGTCPRTRIELFYADIINSVVARIMRNGRDKCYCHVTPASRARIGMYVFRRIKRFHVEPYVIGLVGWTADSDEEATE